MLVCRQLDSVKDATCRQHASDERCKFADNHIPMKDASRRQHAYHERCEFADNQIPMKDVSYRQPASHEICKFADNQILMKDAVGNIPLIKDASCRPLAPHTN